MPRSGRRRHRRRLIVLVIVTTALVGVKVVAMSWLYFPIMRIVKEPGIAGA